MLKLATGSGFYRRFFFNFKRKGSRKPEIKHNGWVYKHTTNPQPKLGFVGFCGALLMLKKPAKRTPSGSWSPNDKNWQKRGLSRASSPPNPFFFYFLEACNSFYLRPAGLTTLQEGEKKKASARHYAGISTGPSESLPGQQFCLLFLGKTERKSQNPGGNGSLGDCPAPRAPRQKKNTNLGKISADFSYDSAAGLERE